MTHDDGAARELLSHGDVAGQVHVLSIVEQMVIEYPVGTQAGESLRAVDKNSLVAARDGPDGLAEVRRTAQRQSIEVTGEDKVTLGSAQCTGTSEEPRQAIMALRKFGVLLDQPPVGRDRMPHCCPTRRSELPETRERMPPAFPRGSCPTRTERLGSYAPSLDAGTIRIGRVPICRQYAVR